jgi:hypothetical protein
MAVIESTKPQQPEVEEPKVATPQSEKRKVEDKENTPDAKRLKPTPIEPAIVRKQVEYYLSDENLRHDKFFHDKIAENAEGWLDVNLVLSCNKMKAMRATKEDVMSALKDSKMEVREDGTALRRPGNAALPKLETKAVHQKKSALHAHDGGILAVFKEIPEGQTWAQVKDELKKALPEKTGLWFVSEVSDKRQCFVATAPFENDAKFFEEVALELAEKKVKADICQGEVLQQGLKLLPKHIREKREKESRKRQKDRNRPILVGSQKFINVGALRGRVKEIINSRSDGESLKPDGSDYKLVYALLDFHPKGAQKKEGMVGIKVDKSTQGENRCFHLVRADGTSDDFSAKKCLDALDLNPPYAPKQSDLPKVGESAKTEEAPKAEEAKKDDSKVDESAKTEEAPKAEEAKKDV